MRRIIKEVVGVGFTTPAIVDQYIAPLNLTWVAIINGTATYSVQYSIDDPFATYPNSYAQDANWMPLTGATGLTTNASNNVAYPISAIRVQITQGTGAITFTVLQAGIQG